MPDSFDPYYTWLGISPEEQPANHYRLLGLKDFEANPDAISHAADRQMAHLRTLQAGKNSASSQQLLNEVSAASTCLLNIEKKSAYDQKLRENQQNEVAVEKTPATAKATPFEKPSARAAKALPVAKSVSAAPIPPASPAPISEPTAAARNSAPVVTPLYVNVKTKTPAATNKKSAIFLTAAAIGLAAAAIVGVIIVLNLGGNSSEHPEVKPRKVAQQKPQASQDPVTAPSPPVAPAIQPPPANTEPGKHVVADPQPIPPTIETPAPVAPPRSDTTSEPLTPPAIGEVAVAPTVRSDNDLAQADPATTKNSDNRAPIPTGEALTKARTSILEIFGQAAKQAVKPEQKVKLAEEMLRLASETTDDVAVEYVLIDNARKLLLGASDVQAALEVVEKFEKRFAENGRETRSATLSALADGNLSTEDREMLVTSILQAIEVATQDRDFALADLYSLLAMRTATKLKDSDLRKRVAQRRVEVTKLKQHVVAFEAATAALKATPDDPAAHLVAGKFLCFRMLDFPAGRVHLSKGENAELAEAAQLDEIADSADAAALTAAGDAWWKWSENAKGPEKELADGARSRAGTHYRIAVASLRGLEKIRIEKRLAELAPDPETNTTLAPATKKEKAGPILVLYNTHNRTYGDRGTMKFNLILTRNGKTVEEFLEQPFDWKENENIVKQIQLGDRPFDKIRIEITEWQKGGGGLAEVELLVNGRNQLRGKSVVASGVFDNHKVLFNPSMIVDGIKSEASVGAGQGFWLLPDRSAGWIEISVN